MILPHRGCVAAKLVIKDDLNRTFLPTNLTAHSFALPHSFHTLAIYYSACYSPTEYLDRHQHDHRKHSSACCTGLLRSRRSRSIRLRCRPRLRVGSYSSRQLFRATSALHRSCDAPRYGNNVDLPLSRADSSQHRPCYPDHDHNCDCRPNW